MFRLRVCVPNSMPPNEHYDFAIALLTHQRTKRNEKKIQHDEEGNKINNELDIKTWKRMEKFFCVSRIWFMLTQKKNNQMFDSSLVNRFVLANGNSFNETNRSVIFSFQHKDADTSNELANESTVERSKVKEMRFVSLREFFLTFLWFV